jgi:hypothetical protein
MRGRISGAFRRYRNISCRATWQTNNHQGVNIRRSVIKSIQSHWKDADGGPLMAENKILEGLY